MNSKPENVGVASVQRGQTKGLVGKRVKPWMVFAIFLVIVVVGGALLLGLITGQGPLQKFGFSGQRSNAGWDKYGRVFENDIPVPADYDGNGKADIAVWRWSNGTWYVKKSSDQGNLVIPWGSGKDEYNDLPVPADYDGDGKADMTVWRANGVWYIKESLSGEVTAEAFGSPLSPYLDVHTVADYDGDGKIDRAVWRKSNAVWYIKQSSNGSSRTVPWGIPQSTPTPVVTSTPLPTPTPTPGKDPALGHIEYFGEFDNAIEGIGTGNYINEVKDHSNLIWVNGDYAGKLQEVCSDPKLKAIVSPFWQFFSGETLRLRPDYLTRWSQLKVQLLPYRSCIAAFYLYDKPYFNTRSKGIPDSETKRSLELLIALIKPTFPEAKQWVIFAAPEVDEQLMIPVGMDAIGMDCYVGVEDCMGHSLDWYYSILKSKLGAGQKLILVPGSYYWHTDSVPTRSEQEAIIARAEWYKNYAKSNTDVVAIVPYLWQSFYAGTGMHDMPLVRDYFVSWGKKVTGK